LHRITNCGHLCMLVLLWRIDLKSLLLMFAPPGVRQSVTVPVCFGVRQSQISCPPKTGHWCRPVGHMRVRVLLLDKGCGVHVMSSPPSRIFHSKNETLKGIHDTDDERKIIFLPPQHIFHLPGMPLASQFRASRAIIPARVELFWPGGLRQLAGWRVVVDVSRHKPAWQVPARDPRRTNTLTSPQALSMVVEICGAYCRSQIRRDLEVVRTSASTRRSDTSAQC